MFAACNRTVVGAFVAGAILGTGLALLYAPQSGKETRKMMGTRAHNLKSATGHAIAEGKRMAQELYGKGKEAAGEIGSAAMRSS